MSYDNIVPRRPVPTLDSLQGYTTPALPRRVVSVASADGRGSVQRAVTPPTDTFSQLGASGEHSHDMPLVAPRRTQPAAGPFMRVPEPAYMNHAVDAYLVGDDYNVLVDNTANAVLHNQRAMAQHEAHIEALGSRSGRAAQWHIGGVMPYTAEIASTGMSRTQLESLITEAHRIVNLGNERVFSLWNTVMTVWTLGLCIPCNGIQDSWSDERWGTETMVRLINNFCMQQNATMEAEGTRAVLRCYFVAGAGGFLEVHHAA